MAFTLIILIGLLFYDSFFAVILLSPLSILYLKRARSAKEKERQRTCGIQFKDMILSMAASQRAGYSAENAIREAGRDMKMLYGENSIICAELKRIEQGLSHNRPLEELLAEMAVRTGHPDIREFSEIFQIAKRGGGNTNTVIADTASLIADRLETERQIAVLIAGKKLEARLMEGIPLFIIFYIGLTNKGFFDPLYHNLFGCVVMTLMLAVYLGACLMTERLIDIRV